ncbi:MAG: hypothetical protein NTX25_08150 [Proteobacteria bacterium]|nr:hypothetical protein [Pseudomonadota bacterium]
MKRITLIGILIESPIYAAGQVEIPTEFVADAGGVGTMFIIIFDEDSPMPMPYGAMKEHLNQDLKLDQPIAFSLTKEKLQIMRPDAALPKYLKVKVRFDKDGVAGPDQPGDLVGIAEHVAFGTTNLQLKIQHKI